MTLEAKEVLQGVFSDMLNHIEAHKEAYNKDQWTNENIVKAWIQSNEPRLNNISLGNEVDIDKLKAKAESEKLKQSRSKTMKNKENGSNI